MLAACGFRPLYGSYGAGPSGRSEVVAALASTFVAPIPNRIGQRLRNEILDRINSSGQPQQPAYTLTVQLSAVKEGLAIQQDETVTRYNLTLTARFRLTDKTANQQVFSGFSQSIAAYNVVRSTFATLAAERDAEAGAVRELSEEIRNQLSVYFSRATS